MLYTLSAHLSSVLQKNFKKFLSRFSKRVLTTRRLYVIIPYMKDNIKKTVAAVIYGVSIISVATAMISLFVNMLTFTAYSDFSGGVGLADNQFETIRNLFIVSTVFAAALLIVRGIMLITKLKSKRGKPHIIWTVFSLLFLAVLLAMLIWAFVETFSIPEGSMTSSVGTVDYTELSMFTTMLASLMQFFVSVLFMIGAGIYIRKNKTDDGAPAGQTASAGRNPAVQNTPAGQNPAGQNTPAGQSAHPGRNAPAPSERTAQNTNIPHGMATQNAKNNEESK